MIEEAAGNLDADSLFELKGATAVILGSGWV